MSARRATRAGWAVIPLGAALLALAGGAGVGLTPRSALALHAGGAVPSAPADEVEALRRAGEPVVAIDLRATEAYRHGHLPGARSIPLRELTARLAEVPATGRVVLYAETAEEAAAACTALRLRGRRNAIVLEDGLAGWTRRGLPLEAAP